MEPESMPAEATPAIVPAVVPDVVVGPFDPQALIAKAIEHNVGIDTLERLLALRERLKAEAAREAFFTALTAFQGECPVIVKTKAVNIRPQSGAAYSYRYAPLDIIVDQVRPVLQKYGLSYTIKTRQDEGSLTAICEAHHEAGHTEPSELTVPIDKAARMNDTQKVGAARTYAMRYAFCNAFGILTGDEDTDAVTDDLVPPFEAPKRAGATAPAAPEPLARTLERSVAAVAAARQEREVGADDVEERPPSDALSKARLARLFALLHEAVRAADVPDDQHETITERALDWLRRYVTVHFGRPHVAWCSWRDYDALCAQIPAAVEAALTAPARVPHARLVRRTYSAPRRPLQ